MSCLAGANEIIVGNGWSRLGGFLILGIGSQQVIIVDFGPLAAVGGLVTLQVE